MDIPDKLKNIQFLKVREPIVSMLPVINVITNANMITKNVLYKVAKLELTSLISIFASIVVSDVKSAAKSANVSHIHNTFFLFNHST